MNGPPTGFWGKLDQSGPVQRWHPLIDHAADVAACCEALLTRTILGTRLARLDGRTCLPRVELARLCVLAAFHDVGKFNSGFQRKVSPSVGPTAGHVREVAALLGDEPFQETERLLGALPTRDLSSWATDCIAFELLLAAIGHHGRPVAIEESRHQSSYWEPFEERDPFDGIGELTRRVRAWFPEAFSADAPALPTEPAFQHAFAGLVMLADWLGSDTRFFPYSQDETDRFPFARERAGLALEQAWIECRPARISLGAEAPGFARVSPHEPRPAQRVLLDLAVPDGAASLTLIESDTGSGKTEAALARFMQLFHAGEVDGLYFALPTRTAASQMHARITRAMKRAFANERDRPPVVRAVPGYLAVDEATGQRLAPFTVLWNDDPADRFRYRGWAAEHPKRYLAASVVVGTVDQVLLSALMVGHAHMRATALLRHFLVVDEVHASDPYMSAVLGSVLAHHAAAGGHAMLMSATLGSTARERLFASYAPAGSPLALAHEANRSYPSITVSVGGAVASSTPVDDVARGKTVRTTLAPWMDDSRRIADAALAAAALGARVLVLRNTVAGCVESQAALEARAAERALDELLFRCGDVPAPHHARYSKEDRERLDAALEHHVALAPPGAGSIVVATQTVQQSLDLDFDWMVTDLCPMDVLLQRIGRLHRHERARPPGYETPMVTILVPSERDLQPLISPKDGSARGRHGVGTVYDDLRVIEATWRCLERHERLEIPAMNRLLVEMTTHPDALRDITSGSPAWLKHEARVLGAGAADSQLARLNLIDRRRRFGEPSVAFPSDELGRRIRTRLGEDDRLIEFDPPLTTAFGTTLRHLTVPAHMARSVAAEDTPRDVAQEGGSIEFTLGRDAFTYDRFGLRRRTDAFSGRRGSMEQEDE